MALPSTYSFSQEQSGANGSSFYSAIPITLLPPSTLVAGLVGGGFF
jgi:hypothetical protein